MTVSLTACATVLDGTPHLANAPTAHLNVIGDSHSWFDNTAKDALADIEAFWRRNYPKIAGGKPLPPLKGGLYSVNGARVVTTGTAYAPIAREKCIHEKAGFIVDNAAYCVLDDSIAWDRSPQHLFGRLAAHYGRLMIGLVFAHEFGHAISARLGILKTHPPTIDTESQADCAAGAWAGSLLRHQDPHFRDITARDIDDALQGFLDGRDKTPGTIGEISHGNGFDRLSALADGLDHGVTYCYSKTYFNRTFTERPFSTIQDYRSGGNEPLSQAIAPNSVLPRDLNRFFAGAARSVNKQFTPVKLVQTSAPRCGGTSAQLLYCPATNTVQFTSGFARQAYYSLPDVNVDPSNGNVTLLFHQPADFALGELFATTWGFAVRHQLFARPLDDRNAIFSAICYTGAYAKNVNVPQNSAGKYLTLSPSDLDEAVSALLNRPLLSASFGERGSTGLDRIQAFVKGYNRGMQAC